MGKFDLLSVQVKDNDKAVFLSSFPDLLLQFLVYIFAHEIKHWQDTIRYSLFALSTR